MNFFSRTEILSNILRKIDKYNNLSIIAPPFSGKSQFLGDIREEINLKPRSLAFIQKSESYLNNEVVNNIVELFNDEYGLYIKEHPDNISLCENIYFILKQIDFNVLNTVHFLIDDLDKVDIDSLYYILSQLRNLREKITSNKLQIKFVSICIGTWKPSELRKKCELNLGSFFPLEIYLNDYSKEEIFSLITNNKSQDHFNENNEYKIKYLHEISGGCFAIIDYIMKNSPENFKCSMIRDIAYKLKNEDFFVSLIKTSIENLNDYSKEVIRKILNGRIIKFEEKRIDNYEDLLLSGLVKRTNICGIDILILRSWIHEITIRENTELKKILDCENLFKHHTELIPPTPSINQIAYEIVLDIENKLRNFLVICLSGKIEINQNPFQALNCLGKANENWIKPTLYEELKYQKNKTKNLYSKFIDGYSSMSSFLSTSDLLNIIIDGYDKKNCNYFCSDIFPRNDGMRDMFTRFRIIRNQIAHNNIMTENTIDELMEIKMKLIKILMD